MAKIKIDMTNADTGGDRLPVGEYIGKVTKVEVKEGPSAKYLQWTLTVGLGPMKGKMMINNTSLSPKALFALRAFLLATGYEVPKSVMTLDTDKVIGKIVGFTTIEKPYIKDGEEKIGINIGEFFQVTKNSEGKYVRAGSDVKDDEDDEGDVEVSTDIEDDGDIEI